MIDNFRPMQREQVGEYIFLKANSEILEEDVAKQRTQDCYSCSLLIK